MKSLPCGLLLCQGCSEKWQCECGLCGNRKRNTLVPRKGLCKLCMEPTSSTEGLCVRCLEKKVKYQFGTCYGALDLNLHAEHFPSNAGREAKTSKTWLNPKRSISLATLPDTAEKSVENDEKKSYAIL